MKVIPIGMHEIIWNQCQRMLMLNPLMMSGYYSALFNAFKSLLMEEDAIELDRQIKEVEEWLSDEFNPLTLQEAELRMFQNMDLLSGFQVNGVLITQMEINQKLEMIKMYCNQKLYEYLPMIRFSTPLKF